MTEILYFPKLGWAFKLSRIAFSVGPLKVYWYGILITLGFIMGLIYVSIISKKFKLKIDDIIDVVVYSVLGGIIGARVYYVAFNFSSYKSNLLDIFKIYEGGIAIYGGIIGAFLVGIFVCKKKKITILPTIDLVVGGLILGQSIGRWGNFINIEAFGSNTEHCWGMTSISIQRYLYEVAPKLASQGININPTACVHPCFFYESLWCFIGFIVIMLITVNSNYIIKNNENILKNKKVNIYNGELALIYFMWYGFGRFIIEGLRVDSLMVGNLRISQIFSAIFVFLAIIMFVFSRITNSKKLKKIYIKKNSLEGVNIYSAEEILKNLTDKEK